MAKLCCRAKCDFVQVCELRPPTPLLSSVIPLLQPFNGRIPTRSRCINTISRTASQLLWLYSIPHKLTRSILVRYMSACLCQVPTYEVNVPNRWPDFPEVCQSLAQTVRRRFGGEQEITVFYVCGSDNERYARSLLNEDGLGVCVVSRSAHSARSRSNFDPPNLHFISHEAEGVATYSSTQVCFVRVHVFMCGLPLPTCFHPTSLIWTSLLVRCALVRFGNSLKSIGKLMERMHISSKCLLRRCHIRHSPTFTLTSSTDHRHRYHRR